MSRRALNLFVSLVLVAGVVTAWLFGALAGAAYAATVGFQKVPSNTAFVVGQLWGAGTGLIAGAVWCWWVVPGAVRSPNREVKRSGAAAGACAGLLSTILLHGGLVLAVGGFDLLVLLIGLMCGAGAGAIVGAVCGRACDRVIQRGSDTGQTGGKADHA